MPIQTIRAWLGFSDDTQKPRDQAPLRDLIETLEHLEPERARFLARFAYVLGRVAHADRHVSAAETQAMEVLVAEEGGISPEQAIVVVGLAKSTHALFNGTTDFQVAQEFAEGATYAQKLALVRCLFRVASIDAAISMEEEAEIHRVANHFKIERADLTSLRVAHADALPGLSGRKGAQGSGR